MNHHVIGIFIFLSFIGAAQGQPGFRISDMDKTANPCVDFYQYACGTWLANNPVPAQESRWGRFNELLENNQKILKEIVEAASRADPKRTPNEQKIGDYYASCMDEKTIEERGARALKLELDRIDAISDRNQFTDALARLHRLSANVLFRFTAGPDLKNSNQNIADVDQGGLSLPDREYYLKTDQKSLDILQKFTSHLEKMFQLVGESQEQARSDAASVMEIETALAKHSLDRVSRRVPEKNYHKMTRHELGSLAPEIPWDRYFSAAGAKPFDTLNVSVPAFMRGMDEMLNRKKLDKWKPYLKWHLVHSQADILNSAIVNEDFDFFGKTLTGARELKPRWKRCVAAADNDLGEALGQKYVERAFAAESRARMLQMVELLEKAMEKDLQQLPWMSPETKKQALAKLAAITNKIGHPERWRDYTALEIVRGDALGNSLRSNEFRFAYRIRRIDTDVDPKEWRMTPPTVNAYYSATNNNINFPAGILQPPFYDPKLDDAVNFGGIGAVIGHELTHGFDDSGRKFDPKGNLRDWWTAEDAREFEKRANCIVDEYSGFSPTSEARVNGRLTLGENTADNGGLRIAYMALMDSLAGKTTPKVDGFTPEQRFFLGWGQVWCQNATEQYFRRQVATDPHSPGRFRVNGVVSNMPEFWKAFACKEGQPMVRENACRVW